MEWITFENEVVKAEVVECYNNYAEKLGIGDTAAEADFKFVGTNEYGEVEITQFGEVIGDKEDLEDILNELIHEVEAEVEGDERIKEAMSKMDEYFFNKGFHGKIYRELIEPDNAKEEIEEFLRDPEVYQDAVDERV